MHRSSSRGGVARAALTMVVAAIVGIGMAAPAQAMEAVAFSASFSGEFRTSSGGPGTFQVKEGGSGEDAALGAFGYLLFVRNDAAQPPARCPTPGSSTGSEGHATLRFADGKLSLRLSGGEACFAFPFVQVSETWQVTGGTGRYADASGQTSRVFQGDVRTGAVSGSWDGAITLN